MRYERPSSFRRAYLTIVGAAALAAVGMVFAALLSTRSVAAPSVEPSNVSEPRIGERASAGSCATRGVDRDGPTAVRVPLVPL